MNSIKYCPTPMSSSTQIDKDEYVISFNEKKYRGVIGRLLCLTASRPDTCLAYANMLAINLVPESLT